MFKSEASSGFQNRSRDSTSPGVETPILRWAEQWGNDFIKDAVDYGTGQVRFNIPLLDIAICYPVRYQLSLAYNSRQQESDLVGVGWSITLPQDYVTVEYQNSIFPIDAVYYLVGSGIKTELEKREIKNNVINFKHPNEPNTEIFYYPQEQRWVIENDKRRSVYGHSADSIQWSLNWPQWRGSGSAVDNLQPFAIGWYLNELEIKHSQDKFYYIYQNDKKNVGTSSKTYTSDIRLTKIVTNSKTSIDFKYAPKTNGECLYSGNNPHILGGYIRFPIELAKCHYFKGYTVTTNEYRQSIKFQYTLNEHGDRLLASLVQHLGFTNETVLEFDYSLLEGKSVLSECKLPRKSTVLFKYDLQKIIRPISNKLSHSVGENPMLVFGPEYTLMGYRNQESSAVLLKILNGEATQVIFETSTNFCFQGSQNKKLESFALLPYENTFAVILETSISKELILFHRKDKQWLNISQCKSYNKESLIKASQKIIVVAEPNSTALTILEWISNIFQWKQTQVFLPVSSVSLAAEDNLIAGYSDNSGWISYRTPENNWNSRVLDRNIPKNEPFKSFSLKSEIEKQVLTIARTNSVYIFRNSLIFRFIRESNRQFHVDIRILLLDSNYNVVKTQNFSFAKDRIDSLTYSHEQDGSVFKIGYVYENGKYIAKIKGIEGKIANSIESIGNRNLRKDKLEETLRGLNESEGWNEFLQKIFPVNWNKYICQVGQQGIYCDDKFLEMTGTGWQLNAPPLIEIALGKILVLQQEVNGKAAQLYEQNEGKKGNLIKEINMSGQLINRYPFYLAYQAAPGSIQVLTFDGKKIGETSIANKQLIGGNFQSLITFTPNVTSSSYTELHECNVYPILSLVSVKRAIVSQMTVKAEDIERTTNYERTVNQKNDEYVDQLIIFHGGNRNKFGYFTDNNSFNVTSEEVTTTKNYYDKSGTLIQSKTSKLSKNGTNSFPSSTNNDKVGNSLLFDKSGELVVSNFYPYDLIDEMVDYFGFESYEKNSHVNNGTDIWQFNQTDIVRNEFSFTGQNYVKLESGSSLKKSFRPKDQKTTYVASCWFRCSKPLVLNSYVSYLKAIINVNKEEFFGLLSKVKRQYESWSYVELIIDFSHVRQIYEEFYMNSTRNSNISLPNPESIQFTLDLLVSPGESSQVQLDVDHIRFSPIIHDFQATVYHPVTGRSTATIKSNGQISRTIYNYHSDKEIALINQDGRLEQFVSESKTGALGTVVRGARLEMPSRWVFKPQNGFYETFDTFSLNNRWNLENSTAWNIGPGVLKHLNENIHQISAKETPLGELYSTIRCFYSLESNNSFLNLKWINENLQLSRLTNSMLLKFKGTTISRLPISGELIVMIEDNRLFVWINSILLIDQLLSFHLLGSFFKLSLESKGQVLIQDCLLMYDPAVNVQYYNNWLEKTQNIYLEDENRVIISETLYDSLGRGAISTKPTRTTRTANRTLLLGYQTTFVNHRNPDNSQSVWQTGLLKGDVDKYNPLDGGYAYFRTEYYPDLINRKKTSGLPGSEFSISGKFATKYTEFSDVDFLNKIFPEDQGYTQEEKILPNGTKKVKVFKGRPLIARFSQLATFGHILSTYEYDSKGHLVKILPPLYHEKVDTIKKSTAWKPGDNNLTDNEKDWQKLATFLYYDNKGNLIRKITPDGGTVEYIYSSEGEMRFMATVDNNNQTENVVYYYYDNYNLPVRTGYITKTQNLSSLYERASNNSLPDDSVDYQLFYNSGKNHDVGMRGRFERFVTYSGESSDPVIDDLQFNQQNKIVKKVSLPPPGLIDNSLTDLEIEYVGNKVQMITYPFAMNGKTFQLVHKYNRLGQLSGLGTFQDPEYFARFAYDASGKINSEYYQPNDPDTFTRTYTYNSPGFLDTLVDPFLSEKVSYTNGGYGQDGFGEGIVMRTAFNATWPLKADSQVFEISENALKENGVSSFCIHALKRLGYLTDSGQASKRCTQNAEIQVPLQCYGILVESLSKRQMPKYYGHSYAYAHNGQLTKAKYFTGKTENLILPLQPDSFLKEIHGLSIENSYEIWRLLTSSGYISSDQRDDDIKGATGTPGIDIYPFAAFKNALLALNVLNSDIDYGVYVKLIMKLLEKAMINRESISELQFENALLSWEGHLDQETSSVVMNQAKRRAKSIYQLLTNVNYVPTPVPQFVLENNFTQILHPFSNYLVDILRVLSKRFSYILGESAFDFKSNEIDVNGNHRHFNVGFNRFKLEYHNYTNKIEAVRKYSRNFETSNIFPVKHDISGNVIQAMHKGIVKIEYHPVSQRATRIQLANGHSVEFYYDAQGERILKRFLNNNGNVIHEVNYLRDEQGRVLIDKKVVSNKTVVTLYIYGPRGLLGFVRYNSFYAVITDHAGSVRLIVNKGKVVAAYDYLPYGQLMRSYGDDADAHIVFRYAGQEWDQETNLYNYHARLYDPDIGRFFQPDPQAQYFSPYKYAGNSPLSFVDPDGEFAFMLTAIIIGAILGAYLGGAAANNRWNPADWDFKNSGTYFGIVGGGIGGAFLPVGFVASAGTIGIFATVGLGATGGYIFMAAANQNFDPSKWKWDRPMTWNAAFQGFGTGSGFVGGISVAHHFAAEVFQKSAWAKNIFLVTSYSVGGGVAYYSAARVNDGKWKFWEWDQWSNPAMWSAMIDGFDSGIGLLQGFGEIIIGIQKLNRKYAKLLAGKVNPSKLERMKTVLRNAKNPLYKIAFSSVMAYYMASAANNDFNFANWENSFNTYQSILNGIFLGKDFKRTLQVANKMSLKNAPFLPPKWLPEKLIGKLDATLTEVALDFFKLGLESWKSGKRKLPADLQNFIAKQIEADCVKVRKISENALKIQENEKEVTIDRDLNFLSCRGSRRSKRTIFDIFRNKVSVCSIEQTVDKFMENPAVFFKNNPVSTRRIADSLRNIGVSFFNGGEYIFSLTPTKNGYFLIGKEQPDESTLRGFWLSTSGSGGANDHNARLTVAPASDVNFVFTGELQGCSLCIKLHKQGSVEFYHHNRQSLNVININTYQGKPINDRVNIGSFINNRGDVIKELAGITQVYDSDGNIVVPIEGQIVLQVPLFYRNEASGQLVPINAIQGTNINELIAQNENVQNTERQLDKKYNFVIRHEDYLNFPQNYDLLMAFYKVPLTFSTPILYKDAHNNWNFVFQKITYTDLYRDISKFELDPETALEGPLRIEVSALLPITPPNDLYVPLDSNSNLRRRRSLHNYTQSFISYPNKSLAIQESLFNDRSLINVTHFQQLNSERMRETQKASVFRDNSQFVVSSSTTRVHFWPLELVKYLKLFLKTSVFGSSIVKPGIWEIATKAPNLNFNFVNNNALNCFPGAWVGDGYSRAAITCTTNKYKVMVFLKESPFGLRIHGSSNHINIFSDVYKNCHSVDFNGLRAIQCEGEKTNLIYTPEVELTTLSQHLGNNLLLTMVGYTWGSQWISYLRNIGKDVMYITMGGYNGDSEKEIIISKKIFTNWENSLGKISGGFEELKAFKYEKKLDFDYVFSDNLHILDYLELELHECRKEIAMLRSQKVSADEIDFFEAKVQGLKEYTEDLQEMSKYDNFVKITSQIQSNWEQSLHIANEHINMLHLFRIERTKEWKLLFNNNKADITLNIFGYKVILLEHKPMADFQLNALEQLFESCRLQSHSLRNHRYVHNYKIQILDEQLKMLHKFSMWMIQATAAYRQQTLSILQDQFESDSKTDFANAKTSLAFALRQKCDLAMSKNQFLQK